MIFCSLYSGSSGNSIFVSSGKTNILIDAGLPGKKIDEALKSIDKNPSSIDGIFVTHEHSDHIKGVGILSRKYDIPIYANDKTWSAMESSLGKIKEHNIKIMDRRSVVHIGDLDVKSFVTPHDAIAPVGYTITNKNKKVSIATDFGVFTREIYDNIKESDVILLESNHDVNMLQVGIYPYYLKQRILGQKGHLSNDNAGRLLGEILHDDMKAVMLGHLSKENNYEALALATVCAEITMGDNPYKAEDFPIQIAKRDEPSQLIAV